MSDIENKRRIADLDSFWDISSLAPSREIRRRKSADISLAEIDVKEKNKPLSDTENKCLTMASHQAHNELSETGVIERKIPQKNILSSAQDKYGKEETYNPADSLIHKVTLRKKISSLNYYVDFLKDAKRYIDIEVDNAEYVPYFSYVPQYNQLNEKQLRYYFFWRANARISFFENTDYSYILLYIFELINTADETNAREYQIKLTELWNAYHKSYPMISNKLILWICDFSLLHRLPPPPNATLEMVSEAQSLKEFFIAVPNGNFNACATSLLNYCTSYDYHTSKFATGANLALYDKHIHGAIRTAVELFSDGGKILSKLASEDSMMTRDSFSGALCAEKNRYSIEISYCSFSRSNELRYLIGDIVKYAENKIREHIGVKSKLTVYSITNELKEKLDQYFAVNLPKESFTRKTKEEKHDYDVLYEVPVKPLSLSEAKRIEEQSWNTTNDLISAFEEEKNTDPSEPFEPIGCSEPLSEELSDCDSENNDLKNTLGELYGLVIAIRDMNKEAIANISAQNGKMLDVLVDEINEISVEMIGDILVEDDGNGEFSVISCYYDLI